MGKDKTKKPYNELDYFHQSFIFFLVGQIFLMLSTVSFSTLINGVPNSFAFFAGFAFVGGAFYIVSTYRLRNFNKAFRYSLYSMIIYLVLGFVNEACITSTEGSIVAVGYGLDWSTIFVLAFFYFYFFNGCVMFFKKYNCEKDVKTIKITVIALIVLIVLNIVFSFLKTVRDIQRNSTFHKVCTYGEWASILTIYILILVVVIRLEIHVHKYIKTKRKEKKEHEPREIQELPHQDERVSN